MRRTRLILIEGLPGSGKSTLGQFLTRQLRQAGITVRWWYEEELGHPVYVFRDDDELRQTVKRLNGGDHERVVQDALKQWRRFAEIESRGDRVILIDSCLFGYLTWSLFPLDVPARQIETYVTAVEDLIAPLEPCLIYLYQHDVGVSLRRLCERRGSATEQRLLSQSTQSPYGRRLGLNGFDGMVEYWVAYRRLTNIMFDAFPFPKLGIETTEGNWDAYQQQAMNFLELDSLQRFDDAIDAAVRFAGVYEFDIGESAGLVKVRSLRGRLVLTGMPEVWPDTPLIPIADNRFEVESLPFEISFEQDGDGNTRMVVDGPDLIGGPVPRVLRWRGDQVSGRQEHQDAR